MLSIIVALKAEAIPLIEGLSLVRQRESDSYSVYTSPNIRLGISGLGRGNALELTRTFLEQNSAEQNATTHWLNFGIAGSANWRVGDLVLAHTVTEVSTGEVWNLGDRTHLDFPEAHICTVPVPQLVYKAREVYDMEAAGMVSALSDRDLLSRAYSLKLISDGPGKPVGSLTKNDIRQLIQSRKKDILASVRAIYPGACQPGE